MFYTLCELHFLVRDNNLEIRLSIAVKKHQRAFGEFEDRSSTQRCLNVVINEAFNFILTVLHCRLKGILRMLLLVRLLL